MRQDHMSGSQYIQADAASNNKALEMILGSNSGVRLSEEGNLKTASGRGPTYDSAKKLSIGPRNSR